MSNLTENEAKVLADLRNCGHESEQIDPKTGQVFGYIYLDNAINTNDPSVCGTLASLEKKGYYEPVDGYAWGSVLLEDDKVLGGNY